MTNIIPLLMSNFAVVVILFARVEMKSQVQSITRGKEDSFVVEASSAGCQCDTFNSNRTIPTGDSMKCSCRCPSDAPTFYIYNIGQESCLKNIDVISDAEAPCEYYFASEGSQSFKVVDVQIEQKMEQIDPDYDCKPLVVDHWQYRRNGTWWNCSSSDLLFSVKRKEISKINPGVKKRPFLQWNGIPGDQQYEGLLIKVLLACSIGARGTEHGCIMFKTHGTHTLISGQNPNGKSTKIPIEASTVTDYKEEPTIVGQPTPDKSQGLKDTVLIAVVTAAAVFVLLIVALVVFICVHRQKKKVNRRAERAQSTQSNPMPPVHQYEYIQYPGTNEVCGPLVSDNPLYERDSPSVVSDNPLYERSPDSQLMVKSHGSSTSSRLFPSVDENAQLGSQDFLLATISRQSLSASISDGGGHGRMSPGPEEHNVQPYQKLIINTEPMGNDGYEEGIQVTEHHVAKPGDLNIYQSLKKAPNSESGSEESIRPVHPQSDRHNDTLTSDKSAESTTDMESTRAQGIESDPVGADGQYHEPLPRGGVKTSVSSDSAREYMVLEGP